MRVLLKIKKWASPKTDREAALAVGPMEGFLPGLAVVKVKKSALFIARIIRKIAEKAVVLQGAGQGQEILAALAVQRYA